MEMETIEQTGINNAMLSEESSYLLGVERTWELETDLFSAFSVNCRFRIHPNSEVEIVKLEETNQTILKDVNMMNEDDIRRILFIPVKQNCVSSSIESSDEHKRLICDVCNKEFLTEQMLQKHLITHTEKVSKSKQTCDVIEINFPHMHVSVKHKLNNEGDKSEKSKALNETENRVVSSDEQNESTDEKPVNQVYNIKQEDDRKTATCNICDKTVLKRNLKAHMHTHTEERNFSCNLCNKTFNRSQNLKKHQKICKEVYICDVCSMSCPTRVELKAHKSIHIEKKVYQCDECDKTFPKPVRLRQHKLTHTKVKEFPCDICRKRFIHKETRDRHRLLHGKQEETTS